MRKIIFGIAIMLALSVIVFTAASGEDEVPISDFSTSFNFRAEDATSFSIGYNPIGRTHTFYVYNGNLVNDDIFISAWKLQAVLNSLTDLYPGTRLLKYRDSSGPQPTADITIYFKDGTQLDIWASSQYSYMVPWNVRVSNDQTGAVPQNYILFHEGLHESLSRVWQDLEGEDFWMKVDLETWFEGLPTYETFEFDYSLGGGGGEFPNDGEVFGATIGEYDAFMPWLVQNEVLANLFDKGYTIYDAAFFVEISVYGQHPIAYQGMLALRVPDSPDVVLGGVVIRLEPEIEVTTTFDEQEILPQVEARQSIDFTNTLIEFFPDTVFILDNRGLYYFTGGYHPYKYVCTESDLYVSGEYSIEAQLTEHDFLPIYFTKFSEQDVWAVDTDFYPNNFSEDQVSHLLEYLLLPEFSEIPVESLSFFSTNFSLDFVPGAFEDIAPVLDQIQASSQSEMNIHLEHPQKEGDNVKIYMFGITLIHENGDDLFLEYCGDPRIYDDEEPYDIESVVAPEDVVPITPHQPSVQPDSWSPTFHLGVSDNERMAFEAGPNGYGYLLTKSKQGVYFSEGFVDELFSLPQQRLGGKADWLKIKTNQSGDVHLFLSTFSYSEPFGTTTHLWRPAGGEWQEPEYWKGIGIARNMYLGENNVLHLVWEISDGIDEEAMYATWSEADGLSSLENVSRRLGYLGEGGVVLKEDIYGTIHAVWTHAVEGTEYIDPDNGRRDYAKGVFYAYRIGEGEWSLPEQAGIVADYSHAFAFELIDGQYPLIVWQHPNDDIIASSRNKLGQWSDENLILSIYHPEDSNVSGWGHGYIPPVADLDLFPASDGSILLGIGAAYNSLYYAEFEDNAWSETITVGLKVKGDNPVLKIQKNIEGVIHFMYGDDRTGVHYYKIVSFNNMAHRTLYSRPADYWSSLWFGLDMNYSDFMYVTIKTNDDFDMLYFTTEDATYQYP